MCTRVTCTYVLILSKWQYQDQLDELSRCTQTKSMPTCFTNMVEQTEVLGSLLYITEMRTPIAKIIRFTTLFKTCFRNYILPVALLVNYTKSDQLTMWPLKMRRCRQSPKNIRISNHAIAQELGIPYVQVWRIVNSEGLYPYKLTPTPELLSGDVEHSMFFVTSLYEHR